MTGKQTQTTTLPKRTALEQRYLNQFSQLAREAQAQLGDLSALAAGKIGGPSPEDIELARQSIGATRQIAERQLQEAMTRMSAQLGERLAGRGIQGSSIEAVEEGLLSRGAQQELANLLSQAQGQQAQALMNLPFQRAATQLGANQALFQRIVGAGVPGLQSMLQERLAQPTTTIQQQPGLGDLFQMGAGIGSLFAGNPAGIGMMAGGLGGGNVIPPMPGSPSLQPGFTEGLRFRG